MRRGVGLLIVLGCLVVPLANVGIWVQRVVLDTDEFTALADDLLKRDEVRVALAREIVDEMERARPEVSLAAPVLRPLVGDVLGSRPFLRVFTASVAELHRELVDDGDVLSLDLDAALALITAEVQRVQPDLAGLIPTEPQFGEIELVRRDQAPYVWTAVATTRWVSALSIAAAIALLGLGVTFARRHGVALGVAGIGVALASLLLVGLVTAAQAYAARWVPARIDRSAFNAAWDVVESSLLVQTYLVVLVGVAAGAAGFLVQLASVPRPE
jgi:hypothetical protein